MRGRPPFSYVCLSPRTNLSVTTSERLAWLSAPSIVATALYYVLPSTVQDMTVVQFIPQLLAYSALALWASTNPGWVTRLGLTRTLIPQGYRWGVPTGVILGSLNVAAILWLVPSFGSDILFLRETPHARIPTLVMVPWLILLIAAGVEINFRGFLLGRLLAWFAEKLPKRHCTIQVATAVGLSALTFSFDPFMVATFKHLHWIAVWDGIVWGALWTWLRNLYVPIVAHAVEVIVMYSVVKLSLS